MCTIIVINCCVKGVELMLDVLIIGAGPAGLSAAVYARRAGMSCMVLEKTGMPGGQALYAEKVENYPGIPTISGFDFIQNLKNQAETLGTQFIMKAANTIDMGEDSGSVNVQLTDGTGIEAKNVILAMGAERRHLEVPGEDRLRGKGVSYCATCDGAFFRDKTVCVAGGGDSAVGEALYLSGICKKVYLIHRRSTLRAAAIVQEKLKSADNVEVLLNTVIMEIKGREMVEALRIHNVISGEISDLAADGIFIAVGMQPQTEFLRNVQGIELDENGYVVADENGRTGMAHVYAAGDIRKKPLRQIVTAASDGANCIKSIENDLR